MTEENLAIIQNLVGNIEAGQLQDVDCYIHEKISLFLPVVGPCKYSISPSHTHPSYLVTYSYDDLCRVQVGSTLIKPEKNTLSVISPGVVHHEIVEDSFSRYVALFIDSRFWESCMAEYGITETGLFKGETYRPPPQFFVLIREFLSEAENNLPGRSALLEAIGLRIIHQVMRTLFKIKDGGKKISARFDIEKVIQFLNCNYEKNITINDMAEVMHSSPSLFARTFKQETGYSPNDFLIQIRLERARKLLSTTDNSISEIAFLCGFNSSSHFATTFSKKFNIQPKKYRVSIKKISNPGQ